MAMICGQKTMLPIASSVARKNMAMICGHKTMLPSCVDRQNMAMICDQKTMLARLLVDRTHFINF